MKDLKTKTAELQRAATHMGAKAAMEAARDKPESQAQEAPSAPEAPKPEELDVGSDPSDLVRALLAFPGPTKIIDFPQRLPGVDDAIGQLLIVPISQQDAMDIQAAAHGYVRGLLKDPKKAVKDAETRFTIDEIRTMGYDGLFKNECATQTLFRACKDPRDKDKRRSQMRPVFPSPKVMRRLLTHDQVGVMMSNYTRVQLELGPIIAFMSDEECDLWIEKLIAGRGADPLGSLSLESSKDLILRLVFHLRMSRTGKSSSGGLLESTPNGNESSPAPEASEEGEQDAASVSVDEAVVPDADEGK